MFSAVRSWSRGTFDDDPVVEAALPEVMVMEQR
jgi:hypothetical protein